MTTNALTTNTLAAINHELERDPRLRSHHTRRGYLSDLTRFETWRAGRTLTKLLVEEYAADLQREGRSPNSINRTLAAIRWWARKLADLAYENPNMDKATREEITLQAGRVTNVGDVKGERKQKGRHITPGELDALMTTCANDQTAAGIRDAAIIATAWVTGARRSELADLTLADWTQTEDDAGELSIRGKGDKVRTEYVFNGAFDALADWKTIRGDAPGALFYAIRRGGHVQTKGFSAKALPQMLEKRRQQAAVKALTWHDFRRTFAGNLLDSGADLVTVQKLMGHSSPTTTALYDRRGEHTRRRAVQTLHVPYRRAQL